MYWRRTGICGFIILLLVCSDFASGGCLGWIRVVIPAPTALRAVNTRDVEKVRSQRRVGQVANFWQPELLGTLQQYATSNFCRLSALPQEARGQSVLACASNGITPAGLQVANDEPKVVDTLCENTGEPAEMKPGMSIVHLGRKTIGVDHGRKRTGVCVSVGYSPRPLPLICHDDNSTDAALQVAQFAINERAEQIVVGFPFNSTGGEGEQATYTREFVSALRAACSTCGIYLWDERFSTSIAREKLQQAGYNRMEMKGLVDTVASIGILSDFFEKNGQGAEIVQERPAGAGRGPPESTLVPVLSYKERLAQMKAAATSSVSQLESAETKRSKLKQNPKK